jgi:hypothetical protein
MGSNRRPSKGKKINPKYWVFCEGKTEEAYVNYLRSEYRLPIEIISKISGSNINEQYIKKFKEGKPVHEKDIDFLIYDADIPEVFEKLKRLDKTILIASNPAIELWFLLHYKNRVAAISENDCIRELSNRIRNDYKKGELKPSLVSKLVENRKDACSRARKLKLYDNPSTNLYVFIEKLDDWKNQKS